MRFSKIVAILAVTAMAASAIAEDSDGMLRTNVAQADNSNDVVILNTNTNTNNNTSSSGAVSGSNAGASASAQQQPTTIVEASPMGESRAEAMRKARQNAEVQTEQKIVEKLEDSRLQEERARAERLFGNRLDSPTPVQQQQQIVAPVPTENKATQVTIERVEIIQPGEHRRSERAEEAKGESVADVSAAEARFGRNRYYASGLAGNLSYNANNVKSNYGLGVAGGMLIDDRFAVDLGYFYSSHYIDTYWEAPIYSQLDQSDISASVKYYVMGGRLKPFVGTSLTYIYRNYTDRVRSGDCWNYNQSSTSETTHAVNMGVLGGLEFELSRSFMIGGGLGYNFNIMNTTNPWESAYNLPPGTTELEKLSYYTLKINATYLF